MRLLWMTTLIRFTLTSILIIVYFILSGILVVSWAAPFRFATTWSSSEPKEARYGGQLKVKQNAQLMGFNPFTTSTAGALPQRLSNGVAAVIRDPASDGYLPYMAEHYYFSQEGKVLTIELRDNLYFSDGSPISAEDFVTTAWIHQDAKLGSNLYASLYINKEKIKFKKINDRKFIIIFPKPYALALPMLSSLTPWPATIFWQAYQQGGASAVRKLWTLSTPVEHIISPGPFIVKELKEGRAILKKNRYFSKWNQDAWGQPLPYLDGVTIYAGLESNPLNLFLVGLIDDIDLAKASALRQVKAAILSGEPLELLFNVGPSLLSMSLSFNWNLKSKPRLEALFRNKKFRQAMSMLMDRQKMIEILRGGIGYPAYGPVPLAQVNWQSSTLNKYPYNPAKAQRLLAELGYQQKNSRGFLVNSTGEEIRFSIMVPESAQSLYYNIGVIFSRDARAAGINSTVLPINWTLLTGYTSQVADDRGFEAVIIGLTGYQPGWPYFSNEIPCGGNLTIYNINQYKSCLSVDEQKINDLYYQGVYEVDIHQRRLLNQQIQAIYSELQPKIYVFSDAVSYAWNKRLGGIYPRGLINSINGLYHVPLVYIRR
ncbi:ABC transporter substrate-binding protein [Piscirickettsia salmonis]|nr:ABC transporter substrate-binding protein [Piscirickettsia salmonis]